MSESADQPERAQRPRRAMTTARSVLIADKIADWTIRVGGLGVIAAVFGIMLFLGLVVVPLFTGASIDGAATTEKASFAGKPLMDVVDEYKTISVSIDDTGQLHIFHIKTGAALEAPAYDLGMNSTTKTLTAFGRTLDGRDIAFGFSDGTLRLATVKVGGAVINTADVPGDLRRLTEQDATDGKAVYTAVSADQTRRISIDLELGPEQQIAPQGTAIVAADYRMGGAAERPTISFVTVDAAGVGRLSRSESKTNMLTGATTTSLTSSELPGLPKGVTVRNVLMTDKADQVYVVDAGGMVYRYDTRNFDAPQLAETVDLLPGDVTVGAVGFLIGEQSLVMAGSDGSVGVYFRLQNSATRNLDGYVLTRAHALEAHAAPVIAMDASQRGKMFVTADANGEIWLRHSTSEQVLLKLKPAQGTPRYRAIALAPRENGVLGISDDGKVYAWDITAAHPETTLKTIFGKVWYEGYPEPAYTWQSSSGTDAFEPKFSLVPLIFGTLKATIYSLLFAIPIALGAAIYTSEFLHHRVRAVVKPTMELMASLPSVVLGFIAALILAPIVETWVAAVFLAFVVIPAGLLFSAYLWQLLPSPVALRYGGLPKFLLIFLALGIFGYAAVLAAPLFERVFFAGDLHAWANGDIGSSVPFTALLILPFAYLAIHLGTEGLISRSLGFILRGEDRTRAGLADIVRWIASLAAAAAISAALAMMLVALGIDPRGGMIGTYVQRNTLIVGFAMGFAVIPIIYTISEDALNTVPEHLRAASLACGATPWQTAIKVIMPTAMSGIFSAVMVGMGRAVGETMIVVMAAGNTPLMDWNIFNGLRALSANIAVELSEAVRNSTLYRMLFLAALTLFVITFVVNTLAELVRQRFRKRTSQL